MTLSTGLDPFNRLFPVYIRPIFAIGSMFLTLKVTHVKFKP